MLSDIYRLGLGVEKNLDKSREYERLAKQLLERRAEEEASRERMTKSGE